MKQEEEVYTIYRGGYRGKEGRKGVYGMREGKRRKENERGGKGKKRMKRRKH